jgi:hypothetical protein
MGLVFFVTMNLKVNLSETDNRTEELCRWYASKDHRGEVTPERYEKMKDIIINYDWYTSCIDQLTKPVSGGN